MFISESPSDANFGLVSITLHVYSTINYHDKIDRFTISDKDRLNYLMITVWVTNVLACHYKITEQNSVSFIGLSPYEKYEEMCKIWMFWHIVPHLRSRKTKWGEFLFSKFAQRFFHSISC